MIKFLMDLGQQRIYWAGLILLGVALEAAALYYQYVLDEWPCMLCIHVRIWIMGFILIGVIALFCVHSIHAMRLLHGLSVVTMLGMLERSYQVLAVERGWVFSDCAMELGMPAWFALDKWFPAIFEVKTSCGYTPYIIFNITMAEVLLVVSILLLMVTGFLFVTSWLDRQ